MFWIKEVTVMMILFKLLMISSLDDQSVFVVVSARLEALFKIDLRCCFLCCWVTRRIDCCTSHMQ